MGTRKPDRFPQVFQNQLIKHLFPDEVRRTTARVAFVVGTAEMVLTVFETGGCAIVEFCAAVRTEHQTGENALLARLGGAAYVPA